MEANGQRDILGRLSIQSSIHQLHLSTSHQHDLENLGPTKVQILRMANHLEPWAGPSWVATQRNLSALS